MAWLRAALALLLAVGVGVALVSGGSSADPRTPAALPGLPPPFLGTAVVGSGELTAAIDAYGDVVDLRPAPAGPALIHNPTARQAAGSVAADTGIVMRVRIDGEAALPLWRADSVRQRYLPGTNVVRTVARLGPARVAIVDAAIGGEIARIAVASGPPGKQIDPTFSVDVEAGSSCRQARGSGRAALVCAVDAAGAGGDGEAGDGTPAIAEAAATRIVRAAVASDRGWLARAGALAPEAPAWARRMYRRSLLVLRALTDRRTGAVAAGARDGWAYAWPRDAAAAALAFEAAGYRGQARRTARFLFGLDLGAAARFEGNGTPVTGREAQGDAAGWVAVAAEAAGLGEGADPIPPDADVPPRAFAGDETPPLGGEGSSVGSAPDYQEKSPGEYLGNALASIAGVGVRRESRLYGDKLASRRASTSIARRFGATRALMREAGRPQSGADSAAAWAVRPFALPALYPAARESMRRLLATGGRFGIVPSANWPDADPWTAPTAWSAWSFAALARADKRSGRPALARRDRRDALSLLAALRRAATPAGDLPERVDASTGVPRSTTPLAWSHAFAILALRELWPGE